MYSNLFFPAQWAKKSTQGVWCRAGIAQTCCHLLSLRWLSLEDATVAPRNISTAPTSTAADKLAFQRVAQDFAVRVGSHQEHHISNTSSLHTSSLLLFGCHQSGDPHTTLASWLCSFLAVTAIVIVVAVIRSIACRRREGRPMCQAASCSCCCIF